MARHHGGQCCPAHFSHKILLARLVYACFCILETQLYSQSGAPLTPSTLAKTVPTAFQCLRWIPPAPLAHFKLGAVWIKTVEKPVQVFAICLCFLRLLTSSLNVNQVFHLLFKTCFKQASTSSNATNYAFPSPDYFRSIICVGISTYLEDSSVSSFKKL